MAPMADDDRARWDARWSTTDAAESAEPAGALLEAQALLPRTAAGRTPRVLDVAGGAGRNALWLARRGCDVTLADVSPVALARAAGAAATAGVTLRLLERDLETAALPAGPWDAIVVVDFLHRPLFDAFPGALAADGILLYAQPTQRNLERHAHPGARFLVEAGELRALARGLEVVRYAEGWLDDRHVARLVARRP
jgi:SAM-dependent methyltransferase